MESSQLRLAALLIIVVAIILSVLLAILIPINRFQNQISLNIGTPFNTITPIPTTPGPSPTLLKINLEVGNTTGSATPRPNCTHTALYWVYHVESWPEQMVVGSQVYTKQEMLTIIQSSSVKVSNVLFIQFAAAYLNVFFGADPTVIEDVMIEASEWLFKHPSGITLVDKDVQQAVVMMGTLEDYNQGGLGPGRCPDEASSYSDQAAFIIAPVLSVTPPSISVANVATNATSAVTSTPLATLTPSPTRSSILPLPRLPTATPTATPKPPKHSNPKPKPTQPPPVKTEPPPPPPVKTEPPPPPPPPPPPRPTEP